MAHVLASPTRWVLSVDPIWTVIAAFGLVFYVTVRLLAKRTDLLRPHTS